MIRLSRPNSAMNQGSPAAGSVAPSVEVGMQAQRGEIAEARSVGPQQGRVLRRAARAPRPATRSSSADLVVRSSLEPARALARREVDPGLRRVRA